MKKSHSVGAILINKQGKVAVVNNRGRSWSLPKGHIKPSETQLETLFREVWEETGIRNFIVLKEFEAYERPRIGINTPEDMSEIKVITIYLCLTDEIELNPQDPDNPEARWVKPDEVGDLLTHKKDREFYDSVKFEVAGLANIERGQLLQALNEMEQNQKKAENNPKNDEEFQSEFMYSNPNDFNEMVKLYDDFGYRYSHGLWELWQLRFNLAHEAAQKRLAKDKLL